MNKYDESLEFLINLLKQSLEKRENLEKLLKDLSLQDEKIESTLTALDVAIKEDQDRLKNITTYETRVHDLKKTSFKKVFRKIKDNVVIVCVALLINILTYHFLFNGWENLNENLYYLNACYLVIGLIFTGGETIKGLVSYLVKKEVMKKNTFEEDDETIKKRLHENHGKKISLCGKRKDVENKEKELQKNYVKTNSLIGEVEEKINLVRKTRELAVEEILKEQESEMDALFAHEAYASEITLLREKKEVKL